MNFHSRVSDMIITHSIITDGIAGLKKFIRDNRLTMCEDRIKGGDIGSFIGVWVFVRALF